MKTMKIFLSICLFICTVGSAFSQSFTITVSSDTILSGNYLQLTFAVDGLAGSFEGPDLSKLHVVSGPNTSTSMSIINGQVSQQSTYTYTIFMDKIGEAMIPPAYFDSGADTLETDPLSIVVVPNPEGIIESPPAQSGFFQFGSPNINVMPSEPATEGTKGIKKKKRKLRKI